MSGRLPTGRLPECIATAEGALEALFVQGREPTLALLMSEYQEMRQVDNRPPDKGLYNAIWREWKTIPVGRRMQLMYQLSKSLDQR